MYIDYDTVARYAKDSRSFTFQAACNYFDCPTYNVGAIERNKRHILQLALFSMIEKNQLTYNPQTGYYKYIGA